MAVPPFTWPEFEAGIGQKLPAYAKVRVTRLIREPDAGTWADARSIVVAPQMSEIGFTLWQCVQAVTLREIPDGDVPEQREVIMGLCYAAGIPGTG